MCCNRPAFAGPILSLGPLTSDGGLHSERGVLLRGGPRADARDGAGMHGPAGLGQCGAMEKQSPRRSPVVQHLQLQSDKHVQLTRAGSDAERSDGGTAAAAGGAAQRTQRLAVPFGQGSAPRGTARLICCQRPRCQQGYLGWWLAEVG